MNGTGSCAPVRPDYAREVKECDDLFKNLLRYIKRQPGYRVDHPLLEEAYETAKELHGDTRRHSGALYLRHPLAVMESLSKLKCKTSLLAAALLHDTMEDCDYSYEMLRSRFKDEIAEIVSAVTAIKAVEKDAEAEFSDLSAEDRHDVLDRLTDAKLVKSGYQREAFLLRFADREHNLSTLDACKPEKRRLKIEQTKAFLIPAARLLGMRYYEVSLNDYCMKFSDDPLEYDALLSCRNQYLSVSGPVFSDFDAALQDSVGKQSVFSFPPFNPFARLRGGAIIEGRDTLQIERRRPLKPYEIKCQLDGSIAFDRQDVCLNEIILTCEATDKSKILSETLRFFERYLKPNQGSRQTSEWEQERKQMFLEYLGEDEHAVRVMITDMYENNYLFVIVPAEELESYFIGDPKGEPLTLIDEQSIADALRPKITVYALSAYRPMRKFEKAVPQGATALDFAFIVSPAMAYTVKSAKIKKWSGSEVAFSDADYNYPLRTVLEEGDVVRFNADYDPHGAHSRPNATIKWFGCINTEHARNALIQYFEKLVPRELSGSAAT